MIAPERYGQRKVTKMYAEINTLRAAIQDEGTPAVQDAWDKVVQHIEFAYRGCPECRSTDLAPRIPGFTREQVLEVALRAEGLIAYNPKNEHTLTTIAAMLRAAVGEPSS